jgi:hypothetical protein
MKRFAHSSAHEEFADLAANDTLNSTDEKVVEAHKDEVSCFKSPEDSILPVGDSGSTTSLPYYISYSRDFQVHIHYKSFDYVKNAFKKAAKYLRTVCNVLFFVLFCFVLFCFVLSCFVLRCLFFVFSFVCVVVWQINVHNGEESPVDIAEVCHMVGVPKPEDLKPENLHIHTRFRERLGNIRTFRAQGPIGECVKAVSTFLFNSTVGIWSNWGFVSKVEVSLPTPCLIVVS